MNLPPVFDLSFVHIGVKDMSNEAQFLIDFGLLPSAKEERHGWFKANESGPSCLLVTENSDKKFIGVGLSYRTEAEFEDASRKLSAHNVDLAGHKAGKHSCLADPDGNKITLGFCTTEAEIKAAVSSGIESDFGHKGNRSRSSRPRPSKVARLGHVVITTPNPDFLSNWYRQNFGLMVSDEVLAGEELLLSFNRLNRGDEYVDHHTIQFVKGPPTGVHHISFEVETVDDLIVGSNFLAGKDYKQMWGIGRHLQGSQIFDYWIDPCGIMFEHWVDTDLLNSQDLPRRLQVEESMGPWGPPLPDGFIRQCAV